jgi:hypothetical protein
LETAEVTISGYASHRRAPGLVCAYSASYICRTWGLLLLQ